MIISLRRIVRSPKCIEHARISILPFDQVKFQFFQEQYDIFKAEYFLSNEETRETIYRQAEKFDNIEEQDCLLTLSIEELQRISMNNIYERIRLLNSIGAIHSRKTNYETAANVFDDAISTYNQRQALALINEQTLNELMVVVYFNSAELYYRLKNWPIAFKNLEKSLDLALKQDQ
jgi:tetratricopeptide (TPR) repeat protein